MSETTSRRQWQRALWLGAGALALALGVAGALLPVLPTTPFVLLAAYCFARGNPRCEAWLLAHPRFGPMVQAWRSRRAVPRRAKHLAWAMMAVSCALTLWALRWPLGLVPLPICLAVGVWLGRLPDTEAPPPAGPPH